jgi:uncharacterized protein DUF4440
MRTGRATVEGRGAVVADASVNFAAVTDVRAREREVLNLEVRRFQALVENRWDDYAAHCHPDLRYTHANAVCDTRDSYLAKMRAGHYDYRRVAYDVHGVWSNEETVLVFALMTADLRAGQEEKTVVNSVLCVWVRTPAGFLLLAQQPTPLPPTADIQRVRP